MGKNQQTYQPGVCNIGPAEIEKRKTFALGASLFSLGYSFIASILFLPFQIKLLVFFPALAAAIGFIQVYYHFCAAFGLSNVFNFGNAVGKTENVLEEQARALDRRQAWKIIGISTVIALIYTIIGAIL